jgi:hypothetical protein
MSVENEVDVRLVDSFMNPVLSLESKVRFQLTSTSIFGKEFVDNRDGSYTARYVINQIGSYGICVRFEDKDIAPCPFQVEVFPGNFLVSLIQKEKILVR